MSEFFDGVQESWESFLDWSDEQGLPLKDVAVALEEKGVPSLPVFLLVFLFIAGALFLAVSPGALEEVFPPEKSTVTVRLIEAGTGVPLEVAGLPVYLIAEVDSDVYTVNGVTDDSGKVVFEDVVPGEYSVKLSADAYFAADSDISVSAGGSEVVDLQASSALSKRVSLSVDVGGAGNATVLLFDSDGVQIGSSSGFAPSFDVSPNANYTVKVSARGFLDNETLVVVGPGSVTKTVNLFPRETFSSMNLSVRVLDSKSREYVANASVSLIDNATERVLFSSLPSDGDGNARFSRVSIGQSLLVSVSADGFEPAQVPYVADLFNSSVLVYLKRIDPSGLKSLDVVVTDSDGRLLSGVVVQLFSGNKKSGYPAVTTRSKGVASFRVRGGDYYVTAFKSNYLPGFAEDVPAGGRVAVSLESASGNSGSLKVFVEDENAVALSEASVALYRSGGRPLGIPQRVTGIDGSTVFSFVPFEEVFARASRNGRTGESERVQVVPIGEEGVNATEITVRLLPQKGSVVATVRDHFSRELVSGAIVEVSTKESASCRTAKGTCSVAVEEGFARVRVTANGFSEFSSSEFEVFPNANNRIDVELVSEAVSQGVKARFVGLFDFAGRKVSSLGPSSVYTAKFLLTSPRGVNYSKALFHARVGGVETPIDVENAFVSGYEALSARITAASEYEEVVDEFSNESLSVSPELAPETGEFKWVSFEFSPFRGTREVSLTLRTRQVTNGSVSLGYRSAFTTAGEVLRDPEDSDAGISKSELLAAVNSKRFDISFEGRCVEGLCLRSFVSSSRGKFSDNFEALVPEKFDLKVLPLSADYDALSLSLIVEGGSAKLIDVESGSLKGSLVNTELGQELSITVDQGKEAVFSLQALRPSNDLKLRLSASHRGNVLLQEVYSGRVVTSRNASLKVKAVPSVLKALVSNKVLFTVKDEFGNPVEDARIVLGSSTDALGAAFDLLGSGEDGGGKDGKYFVDEVTPSKVGAVSYFVEATGFSVFKSRLKVDASQIISVQPADLVSVDVQLGPASVVPITVENLLDNAVRVAVLVVPSRPENLTVVSIAPSELKLGELQPGLVDFSAVISTDVLTVAERARTLSEEANGTIVLKAKVGKSSQTVVVPYELTASFEQLKLDDLWTISGDPEPQVLEFEIDLDDQASLDANVFLASSAVYPLLINHQEPGNPAWLEVSPLSLVLPAVEEGEVEEQEKQVRVSVRVPKQFEKDDCIFEQEGVLDAVIEFFASYQGVVSKKVLPVKLSLYSSSDCAPGGGITLSLPIDASFTLPSKTKSKRNNDDSVAVELPSKRRILFSADVTVDDSSKRKGVVIPQNASFTLPPQFTSVTSAENFEFWFPFEVTYELGAQRQKITNRDGTTTVIFASQDKITFPQGTSFPPNPEMQGGFNAVVPANGRVKVERASLESTTCPTSIAMPDASTITLPEGTTTDLDVSTGRTRVKTSDCSQLEVTSSDGTFMRLPSSNAYDFNAPATVKPTSEGTFLAQVPKGRPFTFYPCSAVEGALNEYVLKFPIQTTVLVPAKAAVDSSAITFASCEKIISIDQHGARTQFPSARSLMIPDAKVLDKDENGNVPVVVPANSEITVTGCACVLGDSSAVSISYAYKYLQLKDKSVTFNLSNTNREGIQEACLYNKGTETIRVKATANVADPSNLGALGFISNDDLFFAKDFEHSNMLEPTEQGDQCREFQVRATLPEALIDDFGCVKKTENKNTYEGAVKFGGETTKGIPIGENYAPRLKVFINVEADSSGCWYEQKKDVHQSLYEFFVNYDSQQDNPRQKEKMQLVFKDKGHERFVTLINNRDEDVEVEYSNAGRHVECFEGEDELSKLHMPSGTSKVVRCVSKKQGTLQGLSPTEPLFFEATGVETGNKTKRLVKTVFFKVEGKPAKKLYYSTAIGELAPSENQSSTQGQGQDVPPLKDAVTGQTVPEGASPTPTDSQGPAISGESMSGTGATEEAQTQKAPEKKTSISFSQHEGSSTSSTDSSEESGEDSKESAVSEEDSQKLEQSPYPNVVPEGAKARDVPEGVENEPNALTGTDITTDNAYFLVCEKNFCDYEQSRKAYHSFLFNMKGFIDWISQSPENFSTRLDQFCSRSRKIFGGDGAYSKAMTLQLANTVQQLDFLEAEARGAFALGPETEIAVLHGSDAELKGCGIYEIRATLDLCKTGPMGEVEEWKKNIAIEIDTVKLHKCKTTLANAPLFIGTNSEDLGISLGRRVVKWPQELSSERVGKVVDKMKEHASNWVWYNPLSYLAFLDAGVFALGPYGEEPNQRDITETKALYNYFYQDDQQTPMYAAPAQPYDEANFCFNHGNKQAATVIGIGLGATTVGAAVTTGSALGVPFTGGATTPAAFFGAMATTVGTKVVAAAPSIYLCAGSVAGESIGALGAQSATGAFCSSYNDCIRSAIWGGSRAVFTTTNQLKNAEGLVETARKSGGPWYNTAKEAAKGTFSEGKNLAALSAVVSGAMALTNPEAESASVPIVIGIYSAAPLVKSLAARTAANAYLIGSAKDLPEMRELGVAMKNYEAAVQAGKTGAELKAVESKLVAASSKASPALAKGTGFSSYSEIPSVSNLETEASRLNQRVSNLKDNVRAIKTGKSMPIGGNTLESLNEEIRTTQESLRKTRLALDGRKTFKEIGDGFNGLRASAAELGNLLKEIATVEKEALGAQKAVSDVEKKLETASGVTKSQLEAQLQEKQEALRSKVEKFESLKAKEAELRGTASRPKKLRNRLMDALNKIKAKEVAKIGVQAAAALLFTVDVRPVRAVLDPEFSSHMVVYHLERKASGSKRGFPVDPTIYYLCTKKKSGVSECDKDKSFFLASLCDSDRHACLYSIPMQTTSSTAPQGYNLIFVKNDDSLDSNALFESVFNPNTAPLPKDVGTLDGGEVSKKDAQRLKTTRGDTGSGKAIVEESDQARKGEVLISGGKTPQGQQALVQGSVQISGEQSQGQGQKGAQPAPYG